MLSFIKRRFYLLFFIVSFFSCSSVENIKGSTKAETAYLRGEAYFENERYDEALKKFNIVKNKYPYSKYAEKSKLRIADSYYKKGDFYEASSLFLKFSELHPKSNNRPYAYYMSALSLYELVPSSVDKDISISDKSLYLFKNFMNQFPNSKYYEKAYEKYKQLRLKQAKKIKYIADYYKIRDHYNASLNRYLSLYEDYLSLGLDEEIIYNIYYLSKKLNNEQMSIKFKEIYKNKFPKGNKIK